MDRQYGEGKGTATECPPGPCSQGSCSNSREFATSVPHWNPQGDASQQEAAEMLWEWFSYAVAMPPTMWDPPSVPQLVLTGRRGSQCYVSCGS